MKGAGPLFKCFVFVLVKEEEEEDVNGRQKLCYNNLL